MEPLQELFQYGPVTPVLAFTLASIGAGLGLRCLVRAVQGSRSAQRRWLVIGAVAIGAGVWTMHLIAMLGFRVDGSPVRYDVMLTLSSLVVAIVLATVGVFTVAYSPSQLRGALLGGICIGIGIAGMNYVGIAAMRVHGTMTRDSGLLILSAAIAVGATIIALLITFGIQGARGAIAAAFVMAAGAGATEYLGIAAVHIEITQGTAVLPGASAVEFVFPLIVVFGSFLFLASAFVALSPVRQDRPVSGPALTARQ
jgi:NO-binding membrane sensor protein with MHYT domain